MAKKIFSQKEMEGLDNKGFLKEFYGMQDVDFLSVERMLIKMWVEDIKEYQEEEVMNKLKRFVSENVRSGDIIGRPIDDKIRGLIEFYGIHETQLYSKRELERLGLSRPDIEYIIGKVRLEAEKIYDSIDESNEEVLPKKILHNEVDELTEEQLRTLGKELGIKSYYNKKVDRLRLEIKTMYEEMEAIKPQEEEKKDAEVSGLTITTSDILK